MDTDTRTSIVTGFEFNTDHEQRQRIMEPYVEDGDVGGLTPFDELDLDALDKLLALDFADPAEKQNDSPSILLFAEFMRTYPILTAHGYLVSINRTDYSVVVEGLMTRHNTTGSWGEDLKTAFQLFAGDADELTISDRQLRCWWD